MLKKSFATALTAVAMILSLGGVAHAHHDEEHGPQGAALCEGPPGERTRTTARDESGHGVSDAGNPQERFVSKCLNSPGQSENGWN